MTKKIFVVFSDEGKEHIDKRISNWHTNIKNKRDNLLITTSDFDANAVYLKDYATGFDLGIWDRDKVQKAGLKDILAYRKRKKND